MPFSFTKGLKRIKGLILFIFREFFKQDYSVVKATDCTFEGNLLLKMRLL